MLKYHVASLSVGIDKRIIIIIQVMHDIKILEVGKALTSTTELYCPGPVSLTVAASAG